MVFRVLAPSFLASAMLLSACGGETAGPMSGCTGAAPPALGSAPATPGGWPTVTIAALDDRFSPACVEAAAEEELTLVVRNAGRHPHNLTLESGRSVSVDSGQAAFITASVGQDGLRYVCTIHPGMEGRILVRP